MLQDRLHIFSRLIRCNLEILILNYNEVLNILTLVIQYYLHMMWPCNMTFTTCAACPCTVTHSTHTPALSVSTSHSTRDTALFVHLRQWLVFVLNVHYCDCFIFSIAFSPLILLVEECEKWKTYTSLPLLPPRLSPPSTPPQIIPALSHIFGNQLPKGPI